MIEDHMKDSGLTVKTSEYEVLLSYPRIEEGQRNYIAIIDKPNGNADDIIADENGNLVKSAEVEEILAPSQDNPKVLNPFMWVSVIYFHHKNDLFLHWTIIRFDIYSEHKNVPSRSILGIHDLKYDRVVSEVTNCHANSDNF